MESSKNPARMSLSFVMPLFTASVFTVPSHIAFYAVSVRQTRGLSVVSLFPHPVSFGSRLTMDTLAFGYLLPAAGRIRVFHPLETCAAGPWQRQPLPAISIHAVSVRGTRIVAGFARSLRFPTLRLPASATGGAWMET